MSSARCIRMHPDDEVAIIVNEGGVPAGTTLPDGGQTVEAVPQGHKVALRDLPAGTAVRRYGVVIGHATVDIPAGGWVHERRLRLPLARALEGLPMANRPAPPAAPLEGLGCLVYTSPSPRDGLLSRMPSSA